MKKIKYIEIVNTLKEESIYVSSKFNNNDFFNSIKPVSTARDNDLSFFANVKYLNSLKNTKAKACLINEKYVQYIPKTCTPIIVEDPYLVFAILSNIFFSEIKKSTGKISKFSYLSDQSIIHKNIQIDQFASIEKNTEIFNNVIIGANSKIGPNVIIKENTIIGDNVSISNSTIMENCLIKSGARIGNSGFGFEEKTKKKIYHHGNVIINKYSTIGSNTTIDRAVFDSTEIGEFSQIDNLVQIAHNVTIGKHAIIAAQVGIAGSTNIGDHVKIGGQAGISGHLTIQDNVTIAAKSGVTKNIDSNKIVAGFPAKDLNLWKRDMINISKFR